MEKSPYITAADPLTQKLLKQLGMPEHCVTATIKFQPREVVKIVWECIVTRAQIETLTGANLEYAAESEVVPTECFRDRG